MADLTPTQGRYLAYIHAYTEGFGLPPAQSEIAAAIGVSPPSVNQMMKALEKKALIRRQPDGPLNDKQLEFAQRQSTRADVSRWSLSIEYHYSSFRGDVDGLLRKGYEFYLQYTNYGYGSTPPNPKSVSEPLGRTRSGMSIQLRLSCSMGAEYISKQSSTTFLGES